MNFRDYLQHLDERIGQPSLVLIVCQTRWLTSANMTPQAQWMCRQHRIKQ